MASAAAVGADQARSPPGNDIGEDRGLPGEITGGIYSKEEGIPDVDMNGDADENEDDEDDDEEDLPSNPLRGRKHGRTTNGDVEEEDEAEEGDLFGDEEEEDEKPAYVSDGCRSD